MVLPYPGERALLTEKIQGTQQGHKMSQNVGTRLISWFLVRFASGVVEWNCWMKQQSNIQKQGALMAIKTGCFGALHRSQSLAALNRCGMLVFNEVYYLECLEVMISTSK